MFLAKLHTAHQPFDEFFHEFYYHFFKIPDLKNENYSFQWISVILRFDEIFFSSCMRNLECLMIFSVKTTMAIVCCSHFLPRQNVH